MGLLAEQLHMIDQAVTVELGGSVREVRGMAARVTAMPAPVGTQLTIAAGRGRGQPVAAEVIGFDGDEGKGSGRSVSGIDLGAAVQRLTAEGLLAKGGGRGLAPRRGGHCRQPVERGRGSPGCGDRV